MSDNLNFYKRTSDWHFRFEANGFNIEGFVAGALLDDEVGDDASDDQKQAYLNQRQGEIREAALMKAQEAAEPAVAVKLPYVGATSLELAKSVFVTDIRRAQSAKE